MALQLTTSDAGFINSGDMRLILSGKAPTVSIQTPTGSVSFPDTGALIASGVTPALSGRPAPGTGSLTLASDQGAAHNVQPSGDALALATTTPTIEINRTLLPGVGGLSLTLQNAYRGFGLYLTGNAPQLQEAHVTGFPVGSLALQGRIPTVVVQSGGNLNVAPEDRALGLSGKFVTLDTTLGAVPVTSMALSGVAPSTAIDKPIAMTGASLAIASVKVVIDTPPTAIIGIPPNEGTPIENTNATTDTPNRYNICDRSGFKAKPGELVRTWDGLMVLPEFWEPRNMQDLVTSRPERQRGAKRPEPVGNERLIEDEYPNGVTVDDL